MDNFEEVKTTPDFENVAGIYINNPKKTSYLMFLANNKMEDEKEFLGDLYHELKLMVSLVKDYVLGNYRRISLRTIIIFLSLIINYVRPKKGLIANIKAIQFIKNLSLFSLLFKSFHKDLLRYEIWKNEQTVIEV